MKRAYSTLKSARLVTAGFGLAILTTGAAFAAPNGSTNIYRNEFARSLAPPAAMSRAPAPTAAYASGSTNIYRNQFGQSFGAAGSLGSSVPLTACTGGSTDIYRNEFQKGFAAQEATRLARCP